MKHFHKLLGTEGERHAEAYLKKKGLLFVCRNFRVTPDVKSKEIDLIFQDQGEICFVEVKTMTEKSQAAYGAPAEKVTALKRRNIASAAAAFLRRYGDRFPDCTPRFDVVEVTFSSRAVRVCHIPHAFEVATGGFSKKKGF